MFVSHSMLALRFCGRLQPIKHAKSLHSHVIKLGLFNNVFLFNNMISVYAKCSHFDDARTLFDDMPHRNIISYTGLCTSGRPQDALTLYSHMLEPNRFFLYSAVLKACGVACDVESGKLVHRRVYQARLECDTVLMNALLVMYYVKCISLGDAKRVFYDMPCKNSTPWNTLIFGHAKQGFVKDALDLFDQRPEPDIVNYVFTE